jgi:hypothetical protein
MNALINQQANEHTHPKFDLRPNDEYLEMQFIKKPHIPFI